MAHPFLLGVAGGATVALLNNQKQPNVINNYYPLLKEQAQLYMQTEKYKHYLNILLTNLLMYKSEEGGGFKYFYWEDQKTHAVHKPTTDEFKKYRDKLAQQLRQRHLVILQTEGIDKLPKYDDNWEEISRISVLGCCCLIFIAPFICCITTDPDDSCSQLCGQLCPETIDDNKIYNNSAQKIPYVKAGIVNQNTGKKRYIKKLAIIKV